MISPELMKKIRKRRARAAADQRNRDKEIQKINNKHIAAQPLTNEEITEIRAQFGMPPLSDPEDPADGKSFVDLMGEYRQINNCSAVIAFRECSKKYPDAYQRAREGR